MTTDEYAPNWEQQPGHRSCYLAGCRAPSSVWSAWCSPTHRDAWNRLPTAVREVRAYAALLHRNDLDATLALVEHDPAAVNALAAAGTE